MMQAQILFLKSGDLLPLRDAMNAAVENRHLQVRKLWDEMLAGIGVERHSLGSSADIATSRQDP